MHRSKVIRVLFFAFLTIILLIFCGLFLSTFFPFEYIKARIDAYATDGNAESFNIAVFNSTIFKLKIVSVTCFLVFLALFMFYRKITSWIIIYSGLLITETKHSLHSLFRFFRNENRWYLFTVLVIFSIGVIIRVLRLGNPITYDEAFTFLTYVSRPFYVLISDYSYPNNHILHTVFCRLFYLMFGNHLWVLRLSSVIAGVLTLPLTYYLAKKLFNSKVAIIALAMIATSYPLILCSSLARGYSMIVLFFILIIIFAEDIYSNDRFSSWLWLAVFSSLGLFTIPVFIYPLSAVFSFLFFSKGLKRKNASYFKFIKKLILCFLSIVTLTMAFYLLVIVVSGAKSVIGNESVSALTFPMFFNEFYIQMLNIGNEWSMPYPYYFLFVIISGLLISLIYNLKKIALFLGYLILPFILLIILQRVVPPSRIWIFMLPVILILISSGFSGILGYLSHTKIYNTTILACAVIITVANLFIAVNNKSISKTNVDNPEIALYFNSLTNKDINILADLPVDYQVEYYLRQSGYPYSNIRIYSKTRKTFVVINNYCEQDIREIVRKRTGGELFIQPVEVKRFENTVIFCITKY